MKLLILLFIVNFSLLLCQDKQFVFQGALIYTIETEPFENGILVIENGKIIFVGSKEDFSVSDNAEIIDVTGKVIIPGLVDTHSHIGEGDGGDASSPLHPEVRILDAINPRSDTFKKARTGGVTTVNVMPGSGHLMSGQTVYLKLRKAETINDMLFCTDETNQICGGMKMANGTNSIRNAPFPGTRAKSASLVRQLFIKALDYKNKVESAKGDESKMPARNLEMEALLQILNGERIVHHHTHRHDDIITVLRIAKEFGFKVVLHHVSEGWKVAKEIAEAGAGCSIILIDSPGGKLEAAELSFETGRILEEAGVDVAFHTDDGITDSRLFLRSASLGVRAGMSEKKALEALTLAGARMLGLEDKVGSLKKGKDADFVLLSGSPFSVYTLILETWIEGEKVYDRNNPEDKKFAVGGYDVFHGDAHSNCGEIE